MQTIFHPLILTLFNSLWQATILALLLGGYRRFGRNIHPHTLRNLAGLGIISQFFLSIITFCFFLWKPASDLVIPGIALFSDISIRFEFLAGWIYIAIASGLILRTFLHWLKFHNSVKTGYKKAPVDLRIFADHTALHLGIKRKVKVFLSEKVGGPVTFGFLRPVILLPVALVNHLSVKEAEAIILHELEHIRSLDYFLNWCAILAENLFFFNPGIYYLTSQLRKNRERNCDAVVLDYNYHIADYASALYKSARIKMQEPAFVLAVSGRKPGELKNRILDMRDSYPAFQKKKIWFSLTSVFLATLALVWIITNSPAPNIPGAFQVVKAKTSEDFISVVQTEPVTEADKPENKEIVKTLFKEKNAISRPLEIKAKSEGVQEQNLNDPYQLINVSQTETPAPKEITIREEDAESGMIVTSHYLMVADSGMYKMKLLWKIKETQLPDSLISAHGDSSVIYIPEARFEQ
jgi:beta-lactamase regulating signal transducer with metallopeptidase domain